ncbi:heavy metal translocating P-type ATPase [Jeotgalibacillus haloalkalitolerans]|uniref:Heavy metal translocating P-type ATPase n=1 Tax=Jeotgalibacillus haloalkalitolerans TaxID=3104292 RepID=A0ABU5KQ48_9BACL|nr:heavy metal translocating P-type ATPase [Jeotgalibacillus sp. HH7-29]MDZ5713390.1 heavy metal translocating P-type ATPase [Jeotgalibacillus sp. HH7-29]
MVKYTEALNLPSAVRSDRLNFIKVHLELILAILSGVLILIAWWLMHQGLPTASAGVYISAYVIGGYFKAVEGVKHSIKAKDLNVELLMIIAALGAAWIGYWTEGAILIFIFALSGALETYTMNKSKNEISSLLDLQPQEAWKLVDGEEVKVNAATLQPGERIAVKPGERIAADGVIIKGRTSVDEATFTGESMPVVKGITAEVFAGTVNLTGAVQVEVTKKNTETMFQKIIELVQSAQSEKSPSQLFIERFEGKYVKAVLIFTSLMMFIPHYLLGWSWEETFYRAMVLLVVASPCALVASIMPASLSAISNGARKGILFKGGVHLENLNSIKAIAFDKTGTLTEGKPKVTNWFVRQDLDHAEVLQMTASIEKQSNHPLAQAIVQFTEKTVTNADVQMDTVEDVTGFGLKASFQNETWRIGKPDWFKEESISKEILEQATLLSQAGKTIVLIEKNEEVIGLIALKDQVRQQTIEAIKYLKSVGIHTVMLTGDSTGTAQTIQKETGVDSFKAECLPGVKVEEIKKLKTQFGQVAMIGDGINDAPALASASVGVAMGAGSDIALETADIVLVKNDLQKIAEAIRLSKRMNRIVKQNIVFSIAVIFILILSNFFQALDLPLGVLGHEGSTILVILNGLRLLRG